MRKWAAETFGRAKLGDRRRLARLVSIGKAAASAPAGTIPAVLASSADREGAFRLLESSRVRGAAIAEAVFEATADRCAKVGKCVYVAVDGSSLTLTDLALGLKNMGEM